LYNITAKSALSKRQILGSFSINSISSLQLFVLFNVIRMICSHEQHLFQVNHVHA
jgi:hypothetical protein